MSVDAGSPPAGGTSRDFPPIYYAIIRVIDGFSNITGKLIALTMLFLVASITYEVVARYFFRAPTVWVFESSTMANGSAFMLGCAYALYKGAHVRTDIFWDNYSERTKGIIDLVSYLVLFFPVMITMMVISIDDVVHSYVTGERSQESLWRAIMWPFRAVDPALGPSLHDPGRLRSAQVRATRSASGVSSSIGRNSKYDRSRIPRNGDAAGDAGGDLHRPSDQLHAALPRADLRLLRPRRARLQSRLPADLRPDEAGRVRRRADVHPDGLRLRPGRPHGTTVQGVPRPVRAGARRALRGGDRHRDAVRHRGRHGRRDGGAARHHGRADDDPRRLRRAHVGRRDRGRRHARHPHSAFGDAGGDGAGARHLDHRSLRGGVRSGLPAVRHVHRLHARPQLPQPEARAAGADGGAPDVHEGRAVGMRRRPACRSPS